MWLTSLPIVTVAWATGWPWLIVCPSGRGCHRDRGAGPGGHGDPYGRDRGGPGGPRAGHVPQDGAGPVMVACRVLLKIVYLLTCRILGLAVLVFRGDRAKDAELLVLGRQNAVLRWHARRVRYEPGDRVWARLLPCRRWTGIFP